MATRQRHQHDNDREAIHQKLDLILDKLGALGRRERHMAADITTVKQLVKDLNDETNAVAAKQDAEIAQIKALQDQIAAGNPVTAADLDEVQTGLQAVSDRLKVLGSDPAQPIPPA